MAELYPDIEPYLIHHIEVDEPHVLYVEECGTPTGIPVVFIHGGPGAGIERYHRRLFDPEKYRIILFDQRGCGKSTPHAELQGNDTRALVKDMESIRRTLHIDKWLLFGGSWGSTLALVYGETHPQNVLGLIVRGIFLCRPQEVNWFYQEGCSHFYPDYWQDFIAPVAPANRGNMVQSYYEILTGNDEAKKIEAAKAWSVWEGRTATLLGRQEVVEHFGSAQVAIALARIECHYFINNAFLEENEILNNAHKLKEIPGTIIQGRYDTICPPVSAWELHQAWPQSELRIIGDAGHAASEPGIMSALIDATDNFKP
jgi:proline iminopeptidase